MRLLKKVTFILALLCFFLFSSGRIDSAQALFYDVSEHWARNDIQKVSNVGIVSGYPDGTFRPDRNISIAEFIKVLILSKDEYSLDIVGEGSGQNWHLPYVEIAKEISLIEDGEFYNYQKPISRAEVSRLVSRDNVKEISSLGIRENKESPFTDIENSHIDFHHINAAHSIGLMRGYPDNSFRGSDAITRAEAITVILRGMGESPTIRPVKIPVLMLHHFEDSPSKNTSICDIKHVEKELVKMKNEGYTFITLDDLHSYISGADFNMPSKAAIISIDDGYDSVYQKMYPLAKKLDVKISVAPIGWSVGYKEIPNVIPRFSWADMREMRDSGLVDFHNHTFDLHHPDNMISPRTGEAVGKGLLPMPNESFSNYENRITKDVLRLEELFVKEIGSRSNFIVYPYGAYNQDTETIMRKHFNGSLSTKVGVRTYSNPSDLWEIPRININDGTDVLHEISKY